MGGVKSWGGRHVHATVCMLSRIVRLMGMHSLIRMGRFFVELESFLELETLLMTERLIGMKRFVGMKRLMTPPCGRGDEVL